MILRLLGWQGIAGLALAAVFALLLLVQKSETRRWKKQSHQFEQLYRGEQGAHRLTELHIRRAADAARAADRANADRVRREQAAINQETNNDLEARLADARLRAATLARSLRGEAGAAASHSGGGRATPMPGLPTAAQGTGQAAGEDRLPDPPSSQLGTGDALIATEQAIQLDELVKWVRRQAGVDPDAPRP